MNIAFVSSQGGHSGQIKLIFTDEVIGNNNSIFVTETPNKDLSTKDNSFNKKFKTYYFRKDYLGINPFRYFFTMLRLMKIFRKENINLIITNGAHLSIPAIVGAKLLGIKTLYIETVIRVETTTWSAKACYPFADIFLVQHTNMIKKYGRKAKFVGGII
jgi:beta-1,4-N-acetylglucosaminyltransferase